MVHKKPKTEVTPEIKTWLAAAFIDGSMVGEHLYDRDLAEQYKLNMEDDEYSEKLLDKLFEDWFKINFVLPKKKKI